MGGEQVRTGERVAVSERLVPAQQEIWSRNVDVEKERAFGSR